ncbi:MAG TPA: DegV family protein [Candidatus Excrementavichristensenella intestinipullorum]|nr:DegV family protein [Candidatus Excrementavichristensenella intestinipullorum]
MSGYVIVTDSSCDMTAQMAQELDIQVTPLSVLLEGRSYKNYLDGREIAFSDFYAALRGGKLAKTSAVNIEDFVQLFTPILEAGQDILYLGFSSALSATYQCGASAMEMLREKYPQRKLYAVDTLCASLGQGLMVYYAALKKREGLSIEQVRDYVEQNKLHLCHWFTVDDLHFLKRGGRISATTEIIGTMLSIKPVMHVDDEGRLIKVEIAKGRKGSIRRLKEKMAQSAVNPQDQVVFISHGDCLAEAQSLADMIKEQLGVKEVVLNYVGPVIGAHSGPGTIALFFLGDKR